MAIRGLPRRFRFPWRTALDIHRDVDDELAFHLAMRAEALRDSGLDADEAEREAHRQFGDLRRAKREIKAFDRRTERRRRRRMMWDELSMDAKTAWRSLCKRPAFSAVAILVLALGIGVNSAMFGLIDLLMMKPLTIDEPDELIGVYSRDTERPDNYRSFSYPSYVDIREQNRAFSDLAGFTVNTVGLSEGEITRRVMAAIVSSNYFDTFGVPPTIGRAFTPDEERPGGDAQVVIASHKLWQRHGGRDDFVGSTLRVNGRPVTVVGVAAPGFTGTTAMFSPELWLPLGLYDRLGGGFGTVQTARLDERDNYALMLIGRLLPGQGADDVASGLEGLAARLEEEFPKAHEHQTIFLAKVSRLGISTSPTSETGMGLPMALFMALSGVVLLIACLDLTNMFLARGESRRSEIAVRVALGGGRARLIRQQLSEGFLLALAGGLGGLVLAYGCTRLLIASISAALPIDIALVADPAPDLRVALATLVFCLLATLLFAFVPAWRQTSGDVFAGLKDQAQTDSAPGRGGRLFSLRGALVVSQVALSMVLLTAAGLFVRGSFAAAEATPGFSLDKSLLVELDTSLLGYDEVRGRQIYQQTSERLKALPGVDTVGLSSIVPFGNVTIRRPVQALGATAEQEAVSAHQYVVDTDYFASLGLPIVAGRAFTDLETWSADGAPVAIIDRPLADELWPGEDPIGRFVEQVVQPPAEPLPPLQVVGVVPGVLHDFIDDEPPPHLYVAFGQNWNPGMHLHVRVEDSIASMEAQSAMLRSVRDEIRGVDANLPVLTLRTLLDHRDGSFFVWLVTTAGRIFATLGLLALFLALVGVYGVKAYVMSRRTREVGIRVALGATPSAVTRQMLGDGLRLTLVGLAVGLAMAYGVARLLSSVLYQVEAGDPLVFGLAGLVLAASALLAAWIPVHRACRIAPTIALRQD
ncbi:MAG: ABC transporter permease [Acidobacteriota bacterium]